MRCTVHEALLDAQLGPPADDVTFLPLWVELYRDGGRELVDGCGFSEIEDAVDERCGCSST